MYIVNIKSVEINDQAVDKNCTQQYHRPVCDMYIYSVSGITLFDNLCNHSMNVFAVMGRVTEWFMVTVLKTVEHASVP